MSNLKLLFTYQGRNYLLPFLLISTLFFLWGFAHSILEVLNPHFQESFQISKTMASLVQAAVYGGYFLMALPAGYIISRWGYKAGVLTGLLLYGIGALLFIPGARINSFYFFVFSLFVIGCGLTCLETSANPYTTVLGDPSKAESRINFSQCLNGLGWIMGPFVGGALLFSGGSIATPYAVVGIAVLMVAVVFSRVRLPEIKDGGNDGEEARQPSADAAAKPSLCNVPFIFGLVALFLYVAAQTGVNSFFINYMTESAFIDSKTASQWLAFGGMGLFVVGRLTGGIVMNYIRGEVLLGIYAVAASAATLFLVNSTGMRTLAAFFVVYLCESIMFPTIFALSLRFAQGNTKRASSLLIMTIVGGAVAPPIMGYIADTTHSMGLAFIVPLLCYIAIAVYSVFLRKVMV
ncbi:MAG: sugar MFS transporter [Prevotellaceae bacterium]|nr:sugar MFS transporter [Prevotellaceae bacterium]MDY2749628.1 sugar MFS transporter [Prevotella sp.]